MSHMRQAALVGDVGAIVEEKDPSDMGRIVQTVGERLNDS